MASSSKFDLSSGSPDRPLYNGAQRGPHAASPMDRSGSFRESMETSVSSSLPAVSRNSSVVAQTDVLNFFQCSFDSKLLALDYKSNRQVDLRRSVAVALGFPPDSPSNISRAKLLAPPSQEEIKRVKLGLRECSGKARERAKTFSEALSLLNKCFPSLSTKKRSRSDVFSNDRSGPMLSSDRPMPGQGLGKAGSQSNIIAGGFEHEQQKSEERTKKRPRTSLVDVKPKVQGHGPLRPSGPVDRERDLQKLANNSSVQGDDRTMPIGVDGWEKSKTKKKRSGIKPDATSGAISTKPVDGHRELKQGSQQRSLNDARPRLNSDVHGFRQGFANGALGVGKSEVISPQTGLSGRVASPKIDHDGGNLPGDRRDRPLNSDKERLNLKAANKINGRDDFNSASPTSSTRVNASVRGPRANSGVVPKLSQVMNRVNGTNDWEIPHSTNRPPAAVGSNNRKRTASARSSSPPASQWTGQHQKTSRTGRRTNLGPSVSSNDEASPLDTTSDVGGNDVAGIPRRLSVSSPQLIKFKGDLLSSSTLSEGEDSGAAEIKSRDRVKKSDEVDQKSGQHVQKVSTLAVPSRKNKLVSGEDHGDGIKRQGRSGRGFTSTRSLLPRGVKLGNEETAKQLRTARPGLDKNESKAGRPPTRKLSDRKSYARQRHTSINAAADFLVGSDDGHEELLAAANAVISPAHEFLKPFWKYMEPLFGFISDVDVDYLKEQGNSGSAVRTPKLDGLVDTDDLSTLQNGFVLSEGEREIGAGDLTRISLFERCLAALIPEDEASSISENDELRTDAYGSSHDLNDDLESNGFSYQSAHQNISALNGCMVTGMPEYQEHVNNVVSVVRTGSNSRVDCPVNGLLTDQLLTSAVGPFQSLHESMDINEKLMLELQSVAIFPEAMLSTDRGESVRIKDEIYQLMDKYHGQVSKKKVLLDRLLKSALETKESQEREFEQLALDKLVGMAHDKYMMCWGPAGGKSSSNKMARQASLAFVKRTLDRCRQFEETGKSCFSEPSFREIFHSGSSRLSLTRLTASKSSQQSPSFQYDINSSDLLNHLPEQGKEEAGPNRVKKRELLLEEVVGGNSFSAPLSSSTKGKRSERDREGKGHNREVLSRTGNTKSGRSAVSNGKGERKTKAKPKQKTTQLSVSINGLVGNSDQTKPVIVSGSKLTEASNASNSKEKVECGMEQLEEPLDFSHLQLPGIDELGVSDDLGGQAQDLASWLNIDDDNLQDHDFMGLEIPMDDLSDLNMMV
ncbi:uncharacterized protein LOC116195384 [Punica granatum]|uniref:Uncharacterized protein LOC116195384 n=1 Tax=Punica granatum TaxID=22663 RepID=A0A6P8CIB9_PUNGR|nr:uncharacterized protein LOC116195384 [Punica granatum]